MILVATSQVHARVCRWTCAHRCLFIINARSDAHQEALSEIGCFYELLACISSCVCITCVCYFGTDSRASDFSHASAGATVPYIIMVRAVECKTLDYTVIVKNSLKSQYRGLLNDCFIIFIVLYH